MKLDIWHNIMWARYKAGVFSELASQAIRSGDEIHVYQIAKTENDRVGLSEVDETIHQYPYTLLFDCSYSQIPMLKRLSRIAKATWASDADVTILAGIERPEYFVQLLVLMLKRKRRAVFCDSTIFDNKQSYLKGLVKRFFFSNVDAVFCYGDRSSSYASGYGARKTIQRFQAAWLPASYKSENVPKLRADSRAQSGPVFLYVGRLSAEKRIDTLIRASKLVLDALPNASVRVVGKGPSEQDLKALTSALGVADKVTFVGAKSGHDLMQEYLSATCLVLPSWSEPWGLVVNEALHNGCPVVVSHRCGCVPELVQSSDSGLVFECENDGDLAAKMVEAVSRFAETEELAYACLEKIGPFTAQNAARMILEGARTIGVK